MVRREGRQTMNKIEALGLAMLEPRYRGERSYAAAYGAMKAVAQMMYERLTDNDREFVEAVISTVIDSETRRRESGV